MSPGCVPGPQPLPRHHRPAPAAAVAHPHCTARGLRPCSWTSLYFASLVQFSSALRGGIAYSWGLLAGRRPTAQWMLSCDSDSSLGTAPSRSNSLAICDTAPEASYDGLFSFAASKATSFFQMESVIAAAAFAAKRRDFRGGWWTEAVTPL